MKGSGIPFVGTIPSTTQINQRWHKTIAVIPSASSRPNPSGHRTQHASLASHKLQKRNHDHRSDKTSFSQMTA